MVRRALHIIHILVRHQLPGKVVFLVIPHDKWMDSRQKPYLSLPTKKTLHGLPEPFERGTSIEHFVCQVMEEDLGLVADQYALEQELEPTEVDLVSPTTGQPTHYTIYPVDVWVQPAHHEALCACVDGVWVAANEGLEHRQLSPTTTSVLELIRERETRLIELYQTEPERERKPEAPRRLLDNVPIRPSMDALAKKWFSQNKTGVRVLTRQTLRDILDAGDRAFNLRVADPYLRYQQQGIGYTWSFFTHKDRQDTHVHGAPVTEIYGVLSGELEIWWKPYHDRGTSAWNHRVLGAGDWAEVESLQCHIVNWLSDGVGVVFKAGSGPLAEVGKLGVKGKTPCGDCPCIKPQEVVELEKRLGRR